MTLKWFNLFLLGFPWRTDDGVCVYGKHKQQTQRHNKQSQQSQQLQTKTENDQRMMVIVSSLLRNRCHYNRSHEFNENSWLDWNAPLSLPLFLSHSRRFFYIFIFIVDVVEIWTKLISFYDFYNILCGESKSLLVAFSISHSCVGRLVRRWPTTHAHSLCDLLVGDMGTLRERTCAVIIIYTHTMRN